MTTQDNPSLPALPDRARPFRWRYYAVRAAVVVVLLALVAWLPQGRSSKDRYRAREGDIARERVVAPFDFRVEKDEATLRREQQLAAAAVPPVFMVDTRVSSDMLTRFATFQEKALIVVGDPTLTPDQRKERLRILGVPLSEEGATAFAAPGRTRRALESLGRWLYEVYESGVTTEKRGDLLLGYRTVSLRQGEAEAPQSASLLFDRREALALIERRARTEFAGDAAGSRLATELAAAFVQPNVIHDRAETEWRRVQAQGVVSATVGFVQKDELIVDANQRFDRETLLKLRSLGNLEAARKTRTEFLYPPVARMLLMLLFIAAFMAYLSVELPTVFRDNPMLIMFGALTGITLGVTELVVNVLGMPEMAIPMALAPLVVGSLLDKRPALVFTLGLTVAMATLYELRGSFVPVAVMGGVTAVYSVARLRHRWHFVRATFAIGLANAAAILAWDLAQAVPLPALMRDLAWGGISAALATSLAFGVLPIVELALGLTSDITLLELSDLNRPLLKRMQLEAPGTYHHSMVVGSLAEAGAEAIGANSLLARVQAYYHDIGKLSKPEYYAENEPASSRSRHEKLTPSMSTLVVKSHITDGVEMARRERLPRAVQNAIPEHHGTMVMAFFYHKALETDSAARREDFSYPGPRPRSKETAILMLADGVEGASRALAEPTPSRIRGLVTRILEERVQQSQLDECGLTLQELARIREAFIPVLTAIFHVRAPYPVDPTKRARSDADLRREST